MAKAKKAAPKKTAAKKAPAKPKAVKEAFTKTALLNHIADETGLSKKDVNAVLESLKGAIHGHIRKGAIGSFTLPGLLKIKTQKVPARRAQKNVPNPFRPGETMDVAARPAFIKTKVLALKGLKDMAN